MNSSKILIYLNCLLLFLGIGASLYATNPVDTRLMHSPAISDNHIAFIYAEDLWIANRDGSNPKRLTIDEGVEQNPIFSPDGSKIAFTAEYDGNLDVFIIPVTGGVPQRLTWHPYQDLVRDFSPDGKNVLFASQRSTFTNRYIQLYTVPVEGGQIEKLPIPNAFYASYSPDGKHIAYTPIADRFGQWKNYRGGTQTRIWIYNVKNHEVEEIPKTEGGSNDAHPVWIGNKVYFNSDRDGEFNLYSYDPKSKKVSQHSEYEDFPVSDIDAGASSIIYEQAGYLHTFDPSGNSHNKLKIGISTDLLELRPRYVSGNRYLRSAAISPSGARAVFDFRGDIITVPAKKGDPKNLTQSQGAHEKYPQWSPDGKYIAYFSDASGEYALHLKSQTASMEDKMVALNGSGFYASIHWSPDSKKLCFVDNGRKFYMLDVESGAIKEVDSDRMYVPGPFRDLFGSWSHDSKWVAYTIISENNYERAYLYSLDQNKSFALSDGLSSVSDPVFDPSGKYIYMLASTDAGPVVNWFDQSNNDMLMSNSIYLATLQNEVMSPFAKENDEEEIKEEEKKEEEKEEKAKEKEEFRIDLEGIENRIINIPLRSGMYRSLAVPAEGQIYYLAQSPGFRGPTMLHKYDLKKRENKELMPVNWFQISANGKKMLTASRGNWSISGVGAKPEGGLNTAAIRVKIDPKAEWKNIFNEAWRVNRDYFYDPGYHGADWDAMKAKYEVFLDDISCRSDLYTVMRWMCSELAVGHHRFSGLIERLNYPDRVSGGLLGADYVVNKDRYQIKKIYGGLNWTPDLRSPLTEPGVNVKEGEYLLAVNGNEVRADQNLYSFFENTAGKIVELTVGPNPNMTDSRTTKVVPLFSEWALRNRDWVEGNMKKVHEATNGQVAYVYVPNTAYAGHQYFKRYFFPQANKKAIIVDERFNGGGQLADYYIDMLKKPYQSHWKFRYGQDLKAPSASIQGPKVLLVDETAGSGGDYFPWMFRKFGLGKLIGKRTWGGLVGVLGYPEFIDGGSVTAPNVAFYTEEEGYGIENVGVAPDIEVEQLPKEVIAGRDPQLEKAIEVILQELKANPPKEYKTPDFPTRVRK
ncbi:MAG: PDZ domain-containing protein [Bacteroidota bacterium]